MKVYPVFCWYDWSVGLSLDRFRKRLKVSPLPMLGLVVQW